MFNFFIKTPNTPIQLNSPTVSPEMQHIYDAVSNHVTMKTSGALLVTGDWGSGKTFYMKKVLFPKIQNETEMIPVIVSLYGVTDKAGIASKVFFAYLDKIAGDKKLSMATLTKSAHNILEAVPILKKYLDLNKLLSASTEDLYRFLPKEKLLICFDDLERISNKINPEDFLGMVNELVENKGCKVLIIANEGVIDGGIKFKEKTIEKTIHFVNDMAAIFDSLLIGYQNTPYHDYLTKEKDFILGSINPNHNDESVTKELKTEFANIRTLKFALEHFRIIYEIIIQSNNKDTELEQKLKTCWLFVISVSVEFKKPDNITYTRRKRLDFSIRPFNLNDLASFSNGDDNEVVAVDEWAYRNGFVDKYFKRLTQPYIYLPEVYNLITSGQNIDNDKFLADLKESYRKEKSTVDPAQELLSKFLKQGYWNFKDEEFKPALEELLKYAGEGKFGDGVSYLNAGVYLLNFHEVLGLTKKEITEKLKIGLNIYINSAANMILLADELDMLIGNFQDEHLQQLIVFIQQQLAVKEREEITVEAQKMQDLFVNDLPAFVRSLIPSNLQIRHPDKLLFNQFNPDMIDKGLKIWQPAGLMNLISYFKIRYLDLSFADRLTAEIPFLELLKEKLSNYNEPDKPLSAHVISKDFIPRITECINKLNSFSKSNNNDQY